MNQMALRKGSLPDIRAPEKASNQKPPRILLNRSLKETAELNKINYAKLIESVRKKKSKKSKKKVRIRLPEDPTPAVSPDKLLNPFENNWLVDTPRDILREKTMVEETTSPLLENLQGFHEEIADVSEEEYVTAGKSARELTRYLTRKFNKMEFKNGLKMLPAVYAGSTFDMSQSMELTEIDILLCFELHAKAKVETLQPGYQIINLPRIKEKDGVPLDDNFAFGRSDDGQYLSCRIVSWLLYSLVERIVAPKANAVLQPYTIQEGSSQIVVTMNDRYNVHLIPATFDARVGGHLVTRPYLYDDNPFSDMMWRYCFTQDEQMLFKAMNSADRGNRLKVYQVLKALIRVEHTLEGLTGYQIKTVLLHMFDTDIDNTPRWQRGDMETCFINVLKDLKHYYQKRNLPHFFVKGENLLENVPDRVWNSLKNRISYLVSNPRECVRILKKRSRIQINSVTGRAVTNSVTSTKTI